MTEWADVIVCRTGWLTLSFAPMVLDSSRNGTSDASPLSPRAVVERMYSRSQSEIESALPTSSIA